jgi:cell division septation protein DedD
MTFRAFGHESFRKSLAVITCVVILSGGAPGLYAQSQTAAMTGVILDPEGHPASGFKVVFRDVGSNTKFMSGPTDAAGNYALQVPLGGRYKIEGVIADDGVTKLPVQEIPPISVLTPGTTRLNVRFAKASTPAAAAAPAAGAAAVAASTAPAATSTSAAAAPKPAAPPPQTTTPAPAKATPTSAKKPWYKRPGPITGMVIGGVLIVALAAGGGGGGGGSTASQSTP